jgi:hypothetical protein
MAPLLLGGIDKDGATARQLARGRGRAEPLPPPLREEGAEIGRIEVDQAGRFDNLTAKAPKEIDQAMRGRDIRAHRVWRTPPVVLQMIGPLRRERGGRVS